MATPDILLYRNAGYFDTWQVINPDTTPFDLTGSTVEVRFAETASPPIPPEITLTDGAGLVIEPTTGYVSASIDEATVNSLTWCTGVASAFITLPGGLVTHWWTRVVRVTATVPA